MPKEVIYKAGSNSQDDPYEFVMSSDRPDRVGDIIEQTGWVLKDFKTNPIALFQHNKSMVIGRWKNVRVSGNRLMGRLELAAPGTSRLVDEVRSLLEQGILRAVSVGFRPLKHEPLDEKDPWGAWRFLKQELLETSVVSVPANPDAVIAAKAMDADSPLRRALMRGFDHEALNKSVRRDLATRRKPAAVPSQQKEKPTMRIGEKIEAAEKRLSDMDDRIQELSASVTSEDRVFTDDESSELEELEAQKADVDKELRDLRRVEKLMSTRAAEKSAGRELAQERKAAWAAPSKTEKPGSLFAKAATAHFLAHVRKTSVNEVLRTDYAADRRVEDFIKSATNTAETGVAGWAAELVDTELGPWLEESDHASVYNALVGRGMSLNFGDSNSITVPFNAGKGRLAGSFVSENSPIPVKQGLIGGKALVRYKMGVISSFSSELAEQSNPQIESLLRRLIASDTVDALDAALLDDSAAVAGLRPAGLLNGITPITPAATGDPIADSMADLKAMLAEMVGYNPSGNLTWVMNPLQALTLGTLNYAVGTAVYPGMGMGGGTLLGYPAITSMNVPVGTVLLVDAGSFTGVASAPTFRVSDQATLVMLNDDGTDPSMDMAARTTRVDQAAAATGGPAQVHSLYQHDAIALRMILPVSWTMLHSPARVSAGVGVGW